MYALDTNTLVYFFKGAGRVAERLLGQPPARIAVPAIVLFELETGIAKSAAPERRQAQLAALVDVVTVLDFDTRCACRAGAIRASLEAAGRPIGPLDTLIAGTALAHGATLVTSNTREFERVPDLEVVDWFS